MESLKDTHGPERRLWLHLMQPQSDFEKSLAFRLVWLAAIVVIGINLFAPTSDPTLAHIGGIKGIPAEVKHA